MAGYSGGGITAYEMAQQLRKAGQDVAVLAMLDTPLPVRPALSRPDKALIKLAELRAKGRPIWLNGRATAGRGSPDRSGLQADGCAGGLSLTT